MLRTQNLGFRALALKATCLVWACPMPGNLIESFLTIGQSVP